jgi:hypothetical protein
MSTTCLIIAFYIGNREFCNANQAEKYMDIQMKILQKVKHNINKIIFVISCDSITNNELDIKEKDGITYIYKRNYGLSFGSWCEAIKYLKDSYDYYILCEDDYVFVKDNFDKILVEEYKTINAEYMITYRNKGGLSTIGIVSNEVLKNKNYLNDVKFVNNKCKDMVIFLNKFQYESISEKYNAFPYWGAISAKDLTNLQIAIYGCSKLETKEQIKDRILLSCIQLLDENLEINLNRLLYVKQNNNWIPFN